MDGETEVQEAPETEASAPERQWDTEARELGWVPKEEYKGDPERWKDAQKFVEDGEKILPIVRSQNKRLKDELTAKEAEFAKRLEAIERVTSKALERQKEQHKAELAAIKSQMKSAVEDGDVKTYEALEQKRDALMAAEPKAEDAEPESQQAVMDKWVASNGWYMEDFDLASEAERYSQFVARKNPKISLADNLAQTEAHIKAKYPDKFGGQAKPAPKNALSAVDSGGAFPGGRSARKSYSDLPPEARAACDRFVADGVLTKEAYVKDYFADA